MKLKYTCFLYLLLISISTFSQPGKKGSATIPNKKPATQTKSTQKKTPQKKPATTARNNAANLSSSNAAQSQTGCKPPLTGVWRGFFTSGSGFFQEKYKYEVQIGQLSTNGIKGVTYSYKTTVFYGKANLAGMYTPATKNLILKENKLLEVKMTSGDACLMTCYLEYSKTGTTEILEGTFTSVNIQQNTDCGSGRVYLEKVPESDFYKEDFVKEYETKKKNPAPQVTAPKPGKKNDVVISKTPAKTPVKTPTPRTTTTAKKGDLVKKDPIIEAPQTPDKKIDSDDVVTSSIEPKKPVAKELKERENRVTKIIQAEGDEIQIDLYDNGQIDDDTITVYHNKQVVAWKKRLCHQPITIKMKVDPRHPRNEFVMVADNLGTIPPNTALMIVTVGKQRFEVFLTSTEQRNAVVIVDCKIPSKESK